MKSEAIKAVEDSFNSKIGRVSATYATQATCPKGYAAAIVVDSHHGNEKAHNVTFWSHRTNQPETVKVIPCPQQTGRAENCVACRLCWRADRLLAMGAVIAFSVHGQQVKKAKQALVQIGGTI